MLEEALAAGVPPVPLRVDIEWRRPTHAAKPLTVVETFGPAGMTMWINDDDGACAVIAGGPV